MTTSTSTYNRAIELFEQNMNGERENPNFKKFKKAMSDNGLHLDNGQLVNIYDSITPNSVHAINDNGASYAFNSDYSKHIALDIFKAICANLPKTPTSASDIIYNVLAPTYRFCNQFTDEYAKQERVSKTVAYNYLFDLHCAIESLARRTFKQLADEGTLQDTPVYTCGRVYIHLYSLA